MKKFFNGIVSVCLILSIITLLPISVSAATPTVINNKLPTTMKVGQSLPSGKYATIQNLLPNEEFMGGAIVYDRAFWYMGDSLKGGATGIADENGTAQAFSEPHITYAPGKVKVSVEMYRDSQGECFIEFTTIEIEQPIIEHNAPSSVKSGSSLDFTTAITNTAYSNSKISSQKNTGPYYTPSIEIVEGKNIVTQSNQNYTNTLSTSETLTFNKAGVVKLKITYRPTVYHVFEEPILIDETLSIWKDTGKVVDYKKQEGRGVLIYLDGNIEQIITINVTGDSQSNDLPPSDSTSSNTETTAPMTPPSTSSPVTDSETTLPSTNPPTSETIAPSTNPSTSFPTTDSETTSPEETMPETTTVNDNTIIIADPNSGISVETPIGVVPSNTVIQVEKVEENNDFTIVNKALEEISDKWLAYDIRLLSSGAEIQPNGTVKITLPRPQEMDINKIVLYHVDKNSELTEITYTLDSTNNYLIFEVEHFSIYTIAEVSRIDNTMVSDTVSESQNPIFWIALSVVSVAVLIGVGVSVWYFKFKKK